MSFLRLVEQHQGVLSLLAFVAAVALAYFEYRRAELFEAGRVLEPAEAALSLLDEAAMHLRLGKKNSYWAAQAFEQIPKIPMRQLAQSPILSGSLLLILHEGVKWMDRVGGDRFPKDPAMPQEACANYLAECDSLRRQVVAIMDRHPPSIRSAFWRRRIRERYGI